MRIQEWSNNPSSEHNSHSCVSRFSVRMSTSIRLYPEIHREEIVLNLLFWFNLLYIPAHPDHIEKLYTSTCETRSQLHFSLHLTLLVSEPSSTSLQHPIHFFLFTSPNIHFFHFFLVLQSPFPPYHGSSSTPALQESPIYGQRIPSAIWGIRKVLKTAQTGIPKHTSANARRDGVCAPEGRICDQRYVKSATTKNTVLTSELEALYFLRRYRHLKRSYNI